MHCGRVYGATRVYAPKSAETLTDKNWANQVYVRDMDTKDGHAMLSAWFPTAEEIELMRKGEPIYLAVLTTHHPLTQLFVVKHNPEDHVP